MKIIVPEKMSKIILDHVKKYSPNETKGALFARKIDDETFEIDAVYIEKKVGTFAFVILENNCRYKKFQAVYNKKHHYDYKNHNYIGDWHSHPSFALFPSEYDKSEVVEDLTKSNANFLIQMIVKENKGKLIGNCFFYNKQEIAKKIELEIINKSIKIV